MSVCGVDLGSFKTPSYVAWLEGKEFYFDSYLPIKERPFPPLPSGLNIPSYIAFDGPQSLPIVGNKRRICDKLANTPTRILPSNRKELIDELRSIVPLGGHPTGFYMSNLIIKNGLYDELVRDAFNPFSFFRIFNKAVEKDREEFPSFSDESLELIKKMETKYRN